MLPIESAVPDAIAALKKQNLVFIAPPGAGKSTVLPLALMKDWLKSGRRMIMLQPRRVVVRALAAYLAKQLNEKVGESVGYQVRGERKISANTRLEIVTEGILTRRIQADPELSGVDLILFDEFHERSLHADIGLALAIDVQQSLRDDLRLLVMSATLEGASVKDLLPDAMQLQVEGRQYPIDYRYLPINAQRDLTTQVVNAIQLALSEQQGSMLVFLPGSADIKRVAERLQDALPSHCELFPLYGDLDKQTQMRAIAPAPSGQRKIVLATNIAETSLTIEGIDTVVDSGLEKVAQYDLSRGVNQLTTQAISIASATQRAGRAGRTGPGTCYRLWSEEQHHRKAKQAVPAILREELSSVLLDISVWGTEFALLELLDYPTTAQLNAANQLLQSLGVFDAQQRLTAHGRKVAELGLHPRLGSMLVKAQQQGEQALQLGCLLAALLEDGRQREVDIELALQHALNNPHQLLVKHAQRLAKRFRTSLSLRVGKDHNGCLSALLFAAFPDRVGKARGQGRFQLSGGTGGWLPEDSPLADEAWIVAADLQLAGRADARITSAMAVTLDDIKTHGSALITHEQRCQWTPTDNDKVLRFTENTMLGSLVLNSRVSGDKADLEQVTEAWREEIIKSGFSALPLSDAAHHLRKRIALAKRLIPDENWPNLTAEHLMATLDEWLLPFLATHRKWSALSGLDWQALIKQQMDWHTQQLLDKTLPVKFTAPTGTSVTIDYRDDGSAHVEIKLTEMYGLSVHPAVANGRLPLTLSLLSPAMRPVQTTQDIVGFWQGSYQAVQKDMKARYPKHFWPDDPANATPTARTKRAMK